MLQTPEFKKIVYGHYRKHARTFPWRDTENPYRILVSEIMLQQTQALRVVPKYRAFLKRFPSVNALAAAPLSEVLLLWQGLGYNRRALALQKLAQIVIEKHNGKIPLSHKELVALPGIGPYTASAIRAFAHNEPDIFIETNIRTVFIHFFFKDKEEVSDSEIIPFIEKTLDRKDPRKWYSALMDYGAYLKATLPNPSRKSKHHIKQSPFKGSHRELRGQILKLLTTAKSLPLSKVMSSVDAESKKVRETVRELTHEGFVVVKNSKILIVS